MNLGKSGKVEKCEAREREKKRERQGPRVEEKYRYRHMWKGRSGKNGWNRNGEKVKQKVGRGGTLR